MSGLKKRKRRLHWERIAVPWSCRTAGCPPAKSHLLMVRIRGSNIYGIGAVPAMGGFFRVERRRFRCFFSGCKGRKFEGWTCEPLKMHWNLPVCEWCGVSFLQHGDAKNKTSDIAHSNKTLYNQKTMSEWTWLKFKNRLNSKWQSTSTESNWQYLELNCQVIQPCKTQTAFFFGNIFAFPLFSTTLPETKSKSSANHQLEGGCFFPPIFYS